MREKELKYKRCVIILFWDIVYLFGLQHFSIIKSF